LPKLMAMIEAYGQAMAQAQPRVAAKRLAEIERALEDQGTELFQQFWTKLGGPASRLGGDSPEFMKQTMGLGWYQARRTLVLGGELKTEFTPEYFAKMKAAHVARKAATKAPVPTKGSATRLVASKKTAVKKSAAKKAAPQKTKSKTVAKKG
jgi:hypothetical protein